MTGFAISSGAKGAVKSVQHIVANPAGSGAATDVTINAVVMAKTAVVYGGSYVPGGSTYPSPSVVRLVDTTTVRFNTGITSGGPAAQATASIVEYY